VKTRGTLRNALYADGLAVTGRYSGTIDFETGQVKVRTLSVDEYPETKLPRPRGTCAGCSGGASGGLASALLVVLVVLFGSSVRRPRRAPTRW